MAQLEKLQYGEAITRASELENAAQEIQTTLRKVDDLMNDAVGGGASIWDSPEAAMKWKNEWNDLTSGIPEYVEHVRKQAINLRIYIEGLQTADSSL